MEKVKCFDVVTEVTREATKQFGCLLCVDDDREILLEAYCKIIDSLAERFGGVSFEVTVDDETTDITVSLVCSDFVVEDLSDEFYRLVSKTKRMGIKPCGSDRVQVDFVFRGIWVRSGR